MGMLGIVGKKLAEGAQTRLARARDTNYTTDTYHGSTHDLTEMDASKTNVEGDWGQGIYSSSNIDDVNENYAGVGPDLTARIEQQRERLQDDILDEIETNGLETTLQRYSELLNDSVSTNFINDIKKYRDNDEGFAKDLADIVATKQIKGSNDGVVYPLKQNTDGFATIGGKDRTVVEGRDYHAEAREEIKRSDYGDEYDYDEAVEEYSFDLMNSDYDTNYQKVLEVIDRRGGGVSVDDLADAFEGDSVDLTKLDKIIRKSQIYAEDDAGNFIPNGAVSAEILQNLGFKGVIDNTANAKFGSARDRGRPMDGMDEDTVHYITFEGAENQIRSRNAQFKDPTSKNILAGSAATAVGAGTVLAPQESEASIAKLAARGMELVPNIDPEDTRVGEYYLKKGGDTKSIGSLKTDYALDSGFGDGYMASDNTEIAAEYRRRGLAGEMYDAAQEISGNQLVPSPYLSPDGAAMWNSRNRPLLEQVQQKMAPDNYDTVEDVLYPDGRSPAPLKLKGFVRKYAAPAAVTSAMIAGTITPQQAKAGVLTEAQPQQQDGILKDTADVALEAISGINRAVVDGINFLTSDQINAVLNLSGSDKRIPNLYDLPFIDDATQGKYMDKGLPRQIVRTGSEFLSPL